MTKQAVCKKCNGAGQYMYDENHIQPCEACCTHPDGWWKVEEGVAKGKYACKKGCGTIISKLPQTESTKKGVPTPCSDEDLMELTKKALGDVLGRDPTKQEISRIHASFKRMAFVMYEHLKHERKENIRPRSTPES